MVGLVETVTRWPDPDDQEIQLQKTTISKDSKQLFLELFTTLQETKRVKLYVNRGRSFIMAKKENHHSVVLIDQTMRETLLSGVIAPKYPEFDYFFTSSQNNLCYISAKAVKKFCKFGEKHFPLNPSIKLGFIDTENNVELLPKKRGVIYGVDESVPVEEKTRVLILKNVEQNSQ